MKIFGVDIFENFFAAKIEKNCTHVVVFQFLLVIGNVNATYP